MPKFLKHEIINVKPILPSEEEGTKLIWNPESDIKVLVIIFIFLLFFLLFNFRTMTFSESKLVLQPFILYNSKDSTYISKLIIILEHDGYELVKVNSRISCMYINNNLFFIYSSSIIFYRYFI